MNPLLTHNTTMKKYITALSLLGTSTFTLIKSGEVIRDAAMSGTIGVLIAMALIMGVMGFWGWLMTFGMESIHPGLYVDENDSTTMQELCDKWYPNGPPW